MSIKVLYLDNKHNKTTKDIAKWKVVHEYDEKGKLQKEAWVLLKKKEKKQQEGTWSPRYTEEEEED